MAGFGDVTFFDGFDGTAVDRGRWPVLYESAPGETDWRGAFRWEADNVKVRNGGLTLGLDDRDGDGLWDVGGLSSTPEWWGPGAAFTYGKVEIRAKASQELVAAGPVFLLWPAADDHWPPEVNIPETPGATACPSTTGRGRAATATTSSTRSASPSTTPGGTPTRWSGCRTASRSSWAGGTSTASPRTSRTSR
jgi:hypothetical protein